MAKCEPGRRSGSTSQATNCVRRVVAGSNHSTAKEAVHELTAVEAKWKALIEQIDLRLVHDRDGPQ
jgi:hypothetical protein